GPGVNKLTWAGTPGASIAYLALGEWWKRWGFQAWPLTTGSAGAVAEPFNSTARLWLSVAGPLFVTRNGNPGGAISAVASVKMSVSDSKFSGNFAGSNVAGGGAICVLGPLSVTNSTFTENLTSGYGGAIDFQNVTAGTANSSISDSTFDGNGSDAGGGLFVAVFGSVMSVTNCSFTRNTSTILNSKGGGIYQSTGTLNITRSTLSGNEGYGISIGAFTNITTNISDSTISGNTFGGIETEYSTTVDGKLLNVTNSTITNNTGGPGLNLFKTTLNVSNSTISYNECGIRRNWQDNNGTWTVKSSI